MVKKIAGTLMALALVGMFVGCASDTSYTKVSREEAMQMIEADKDLVIVDVRTQQEYEGGHIPNAINIPNESIGGDELPALPDKDQAIMVYCRSGARSSQAANKLAAMGYGNVYDLGGLNVWQGQLSTD